MKRFSCLLLFALLLLLPAGCAAAKKAPVPAPSELAGELIGAGAFTDLQEPAPSRSGCILYGLDESAATEMLFYFSSGATAQELAVFVCADEAAASAVRAAAEARLAHQIESFSDYVPQEVPGLERARIRTSGLCVVLCVAADDAAANAVLDKYF